MAAIGVGCDCGESSDSADGASDDDLLFDDDQDGDDTNDDDQSDDDTSDDDTVDDDTVDDDTVDDDTADDDTTDDDDLDDDTFVDPCEGVEQVYDPVPPWEEDGVTFRELIPPCVGCDGLSIAVNAQDQPVIAATRGSYLMLYTRTSECGWTREAVTRHGIDPILKADGDGFLHLLFYDENESVLKYGTNETGAFAFETVPWPEELDPADGIVFDMALDADGFAHMAMAQSLWSGPVLTTCNRTDSWIDRIVDTDLFYSADSIAIAVGPDGYEHVAVDYWTMWGPGTNVWSETAQGFPPENESDGFDTFFPDLAVDSESNPRMVTNGEEIHYWEKVGGVWTDVLFNFGLCWSNSMLVVDEFDVVHVGFCPYSLFPYIRYDNGDLTGIAYPVDETPMQNSLTASNGVAHMAFGSDKHLFYLTPTENGRHLRSQRLDFGVRNVTSAAAVQSEDGATHWCATESESGQRVFYGRIAESEEVTTIDVFDNDGYHYVGNCSIVLDAEFKPHLFVVATQNGSTEPENLYELTSTETGWIFTLVDEDIHWGGPASANLQNGELAVFYRKSQNLWVASSTQDQWERSDTGYTIEYWLDAVADVNNDTLYVAFDQPNSLSPGETHIVVLKKYSDNAWETILTTSLGENPILELSESDALHLIYADSTLNFPSNVIYQGYNGESWSEPFVLGVGVASMAMTSLPGADHIFIAGGGMTSYDIVAGSDTNWGSIASAAMHRLNGDWRSAVFPKADGQNIAGLVFLDSFLELSIPIE